MQYLDQEHAFLTSESVTEGHPDKMADQISDAVLDEALRQDEESRVAVETLLTNGLVFVAGEVRTRGYIDVPRIVRGVIKNIGYTNSTMGFDWETCGVTVAIQEQSADIAAGVDPSGSPAFSRRGSGGGSSKKEDLTKLGAGDQGLMYGYATTETRELMPLPITLAHKLVRRLAQVRKNGTLKYLRPDGKAQVTLEYRGGRAVHLKNVVVSCQHNPDVTHAKIERDVIRNVLKPILPKKLFDKKTKIYVNATGRFVSGGPQADTGLTGRKIIVDTYGGVGSHGGGCFSGKDPSKVDRSGSYAARWVAVNLVKAGLASQVEVQVAYVIGVSEPLSVNVNSYGTGVVSDDELARAIKKVFDLRPGMIIKHLDLRRPIYGSTASYGHFGRLDLNLPWERASRVAELKRAVR
ncbi:MAG: methionine adenosyltransferase [Parcubacteria group bacterium]|nr:methionine adenosyltransferase [Parcubacteria group bacterium]